MTDELEEEVYKFFCELIKENPEPHYLQIGSAIQSAFMRIMDKMERELEASRATEWMRKRYGNE